MNSQPRTDDSGGDLIRGAIHSARPRLSRQLAQSFLLLSLAVLAVVFAGCGVQAPPQPPRVQIPQQIKDLRAHQVGRTLQITFTMPTLATDGEGLTKPVEIDIFRAIAPAGQAPSPPETTGAPWKSLLPHELPHYVHNGKLDYPLQFSPQEFHQQQGSTFSFAVIALTRAFLGRERKSEPSNVAHATLVDVTQPVTHFAVKASQTALLLSWEKPVKTLTGAAPTHLTGYRVYLSTTSKPDTFQLLARTAATHYDDTNFHFGRRYYFRVSAVTTVGKTVAESALSSTVSIRPRDVFPPAVPTGLKAVNAAGAVDLLWTANTDRDLAGYNVYRSTNGGPFERINKKLVLTPIFHDATVAPGRRYQYAVTAVDLAGNESARSKPAGVTTPSPGSH